VAGVAVVVGSVVTILEKLRPCAMTIQISEVQGTEYPCVEFLIQSSCARLLTEVSGTVVGVEAVKWAPSVEDLSSVSVSGIYDVSVDIEEVTTIGWAFTKDIHQQVGTGEHDRFRLRLLPRVATGIEALSDMESDAFAVTISIEVNDVSGRTMGSGEVQLVFNSEYRTLVGTRIVEL
jgi:hypothetical protein